MTKISIIIPSPCSDRNILLLSKALSSLDQCSEGKHDREIIVVANNWSGFSTPVNKGIKQSTGEFVLIMNDDVQILAPWEDAMLAPFKNPEVGIVGHSGTQQHDWKYSAMWFTMIRREVFNKIGLLDENMNVFSQDIDFGKRAYDAGYKTVFVDVPVKHAWSQSVMHLKDQEGLIKQAKEVFKQKHGVEHDRA